MLTYAGLRGAVSLMLALMVQNSEFIDPKIKGLILFHTSGIVLMTLLINGTTCGYLVRKLKLSKESKVSKKLMC